MSSFCRGEDGTAIVLQCLGVPVCVFHFSLIDVAPINVGKTRNPIMKFCMLFCQLLICQGSRLIHFAKVIDQTSLKKGAAVVVL